MAVPPQRTAPELHRRHRWIGTGRRSVTLDGFALVWREAARSTHLPCIGRAHFRRGHGRELYSRPQGGSGRPDGDTPQRMSYKVGRTPWSAADALVGLLASPRNSIHWRLRVQGDPRGPL